jgi:hypothetical protein
MARPRKNPDDPKWQPIQNVGTSEQVPTEWLTLYAAVLTGLVARGGFSEDQMVKTAAQYADLAYTFITSPRK